MNTHSTHRHSPASLESHPTQSFTDSEPIGSPSLRSLSLSSDPCSVTTPHISEDKRDSTIGMLTDNVLLEIFYFYQAVDRNDPNVRGLSDRDLVMPLRNWRRLMHVCQRWRQIIFESPRRLNLQITCTLGIRFKKSLGIWPDFPIAITHPFYFGIDSIHEDDVIAALGHPGRVLIIQLTITGSQLEKMATLLSKPFPVLTCLHIRSKNGVHGEELDLPSGFLGGSAPCLEEITLSHISFPALPTLLSSAKNLVKLFLHKVPSTSYISPDALVACLVELPRLGTLSLEFESATVHLGQIHPPPITRTVLRLLPALRHFQFDGASQYLEDVVAQIDCPVLAKITVSYTNPVVDLQVAQLAKFVNRSWGPETSPYEPTKVHLTEEYVSILMYQDQKHPIHDWDPCTTSIIYYWTGQQVPPIAKVLNQFSAILSTVAYLSLVSGDRYLGERDDVDWLHLLHPFSAVQTLHVSWELAGHIAPALEDIPAEIVTEVLPSLCLTYLEGHSKSSLETFVAARALSNRPVIVADGKVEYDDILRSVTELPVEGATEPE